MGEWKAKGFDCDGLVDRLIEGWEPVDLVGKLLAPSAWAGGFHQPVTIPAAPIAPIAPPFRGETLTTSITWPTPPVTTAVWSPDPLPDDRRGDPVTEALNFLWDQTLHKPEAEAVEMQKHIIALKRGLGLE